jgi:peptidoglycan/LPS O-acetylase OafA/YrhL
MFLILSGYFMTASLIKVRQGHRPLGSIYRQRYLRLAPLYLLTLLFFLTALPIAGAAFSGRSVFEFLPRTESLIYYLFGSANLSAARFGFVSLFDVTWTLSVQEQFFLLWIPAATFLPRRALTAVAIAVIAVAVFARPLAASFGVSPVSIHVLTPFRMDALAIGALIALAGHRTEGRVPTVPPAAAFAALAGFTVLLFICPFQHASWYPRIGYTLLGAVATLCVLAVFSLRTGSLTHRILSAPPLVWYGQRSYAIYLLHGPVLYALRTIGWVVAGKSYERGMMKPTDTSWVLGLVTVFACVPVAWLAWRFVERPIERIRKGPATTPAPVPAPETKRISTEDLGTAVSPALAATSQPARVYDDEDALTPPMGMTALA